MQQKLLGVLTWVEDHDTSCTVTNPDGTQSTIKYKYSEHISHHNQAKHRVNDTSNQQNDSLAFSAVWRKNWWPNGQLTYY